MDIKPQKFDECFRLRKYKNAQIEIGNSLNSPAAKLSSMTPFRLCFTFLCFASAQARSKLRSDPRRELADVVSILLLAFVSEICAS